MSRRKGSAGAEEILDEEGPRRRATEKEEEEPEYAVYSGWGSVEGRRGVYDRYGHKVSGQKVEDIQKAIAPIIDKWHLGDVLKVVQAVEDVPERHRKPNMAAVYIGEQKKILLVADRLRDKEDAQRRLFHEALGHYGLREMFGPKMDQFLKLVYRQIPVLDLYHIAETWDLDLTTPEGRLTAASEYMAVLAERTIGRGTPPSLLQKLYAKIRQMLREMGFDVELKDFEIRSALAEAARRLEKGQRGIEEKGAGAEYSLTQTRENLFDFLQKFKARYTLNISDKDLGKIRAFFGNPWDVAQKDPQFHKILDRQLARDEAREELLHRLLSNTIKDSPSKQHEFLALPPDQLHPRYAEKHDRPGKTLRKSQKHCHRLLAQR